MVVVTENFVPDEETLEIAGNQIRVDEREQLILRREVGNGFWEVQKLSNGAIGTVPAGCFE